VAGIGDSAWNHADLGAAGFLGWVTFETLTGPLWSGEPSVTLSG
jgi:hypothetical protein